MKKWIWCARLAVLAQAGPLLCPAQAWADEPLAEPVLPDVVVTATRVATRADELTSEVVVVGREEIERSAGRTLTEVLARTASVQVANNGGRGKASGVFIRGTESRHTILLVDGVRYGSATGGAPVWDTLPVEMIERIEVLKGPASALYGADAAGGVVQVFTRRGLSQDGVVTYAAVTVGSHQFREVSAGVRGGQGAVSYALGVSHMDDDGFSATNDKVPFGMFNPDRDGVNKKGVDASLDWKLAPGWKFSLGGVYSDGTVHFDDGPDVDTRSAVRTTVLRTGVQGQVLPGWVTRVDFHRSVDRSNALVSANPFNVPGLFETQQEQWSWQNDVQTPWGTLMAGLETLQQTVNSSTPYTVTQRRINSTFAGVTGSAGAHSWQLNARHDRNSQFGGRSTGYAGYGYQLTSQWRAHAGYGTSFVAPSFNQLYYPGWSNPHLQPERGKNAELGLDWTQGVHHAKLIRFDNRIRGFITSGQNPENVPRSRMKGWTLGYDSRWAGLSWRAVLDSLDARNESSDKRLPRRARTQWTVGADYGVGPWSVGGSLLHMGQRFDDVANAVVLGAYTTLDMYASYAIARDWSAQLKLNNLGNRRYETARGYNQPGREVFATLRYTPR